MEGRQFGRYTADLRVHRWSDFVVLRSGKLIDGDGVILGGRRRIGDLWADTELGSGGPCSLPSHTANGALGLLSVIITSPERSIVW